MYRRGLDGHGQSHRILAECIHSFPVASDDNHSRRHARHTDRDGTRNARSAEAQRRLVGLDRRRSLRGAGGGGRVRPSGAGPGAILDRLARRPDLQLQAARRAQMERRPAARVRRFPPCIPPPARPRDRGRVRLHPVSDQERGSLQQRHDDRPGSAGRCGAGQEHRRHHAGTADALFPAGTRPAGRLSGAASSRRKARRRLGETAEHRQQRRLQTGRMEFRDGYSRGRATRITGLLATSSSTR